MKKFSLALIVIGLMFTTRLLAVNIVKLDIGPENSLKPWFIHSDRWMTWNIKGTIGSEKINGLIGPNFLQIAGVSIGPFIGLELNTSKSLVISGIPIALVPSFEIGALSFNLINAYTFGLEGNQDVLFLKYTGMISFTGLRYEGLKTGDGKTVSKVGPIGVYKFKNHSLEGWFGVKVDDFEQKTLKLSYKIVM